MKKEFSKIHNIGMFDGKFPVADDIDFCNDEIAEMFGVSDAEQLDTKTVIKNGLAGNELVGPFESVSDFMRNLYEDD